MRLRTLANHDQAEDLMRQLVPFRSRVRLYDRHGNFGPFVSLSGTPPCGSGQFPPVTSEGCAIASAKQGETAWMGKTEGTISGFCHDVGNLPEQYHESLLSSDFVVRSFNTPIAWHVNIPQDWSDPADVAAWLDDDHPGMWVIPDVAYSLTTNHHQWTVRYALEGSWRNNHPALPTTHLHVEGAPARVPSGSR